MADPDLLNMEIYAAPRSVRTMDLGHHYRN